MEGAGFDEQRASPWGMSEMASFSASTDAEKNEMASHPESPMLSKYSYESGSF